MNDFEINGQKYKTNKMPPMVQFHVARRMGPIMGDLIPVLRELKGGTNGGATDSEKLESIAKFIAPIMNGLQKLSDADSEYCMMQLISACEMMQGTMWAKMGDGRMLNFQNMDLPVMLQIAAKSFMANLSGFFSAAPQVSHQGK